MSTIKSQATWLFVQQHVQATNKENIKALHHWPFCGEVTGIWWFPFEPSQRVIDHYSDIIMSMMASQFHQHIDCLLNCSGADQRKHQSSSSLAFVSGIHRWPVASPHKVPVTWIMFPFEDIIMAGSISMPWYHFGINHRSLWAGLSGTLSLKI